MKKLLIILAFLWAAPKMEASPSNMAPPPFTVTFQVFYNDLAPYGQWVNDPQYGYIWLPLQVQSSWRPYTMGHWVYTVYGWTWVSDSPWGWAPFHYGRWGYSQLYGWFWVPGYDWGPSWVLWRYDDSYFGWAPLGPGMVITTVYSTHYYINPYYWCFVPRHQFMHRHLYQYCLPPDRNDAVVRNSQPVMNVHRESGGSYFEGPPTKTVSSSVGQRITASRVVEAEKPGMAVENQSELRIYRPEVKKEPVSKDIRPHDVTPVREIQAPTRKELPKPQEKPPVEKRPSTQPGIPKPSDKKYAPRPTNPTEQPSREVAPTPQPSKEQPNREPVPSREVPQRTPEPQRVPEPSKKVVPKKEVPSREKKIPKKEKTKIERSVSPSRQVSPTTAPKRSTPAPSDNPSKRRYR